MAHFDGSKMELQLSAQTPLIHFQPKQAGATLRASEVKPKLDRFLLQRGVPGDVLKKTLYSNTQAFRYKMKIEPVGEKITRIDLKNNDYSIFFGNIKVPEEKRKYGILCDIKVTIICFYEELKPYIAKNIEDFFVVTNFGFMQNKGFGSFLPEDFSYSKEQVCCLLEEKMQAIKSYYYTAPDGKVFKPFVWIKDFYGNIRKKSFFETTLKPERFPSPVYFKVIGRTVYFTLAKLPEKYSNGVVLKVRSKKIQTLVAQGRGMYSYFHNYVTKFSTYKDDIFIHERKEEDK